MGFSLAAEAVAKGAKVTLISGPVNLPTPQGVTRIDVESAEQMHAEAQRLAPQAALFIGCAAVADYRAATPAEHKLKKQDDSDTLTLTLVKNPDIIASIAALPAEQRPLVVGFAAETQQVERYARDKLQRKRLDMIVANDVSQAGLGFGSDQNAAWLLWRTAGGIESRSEAAQPKTQLAATIIHQALALLEKASEIAPTKTSGESL